MALLSKSLDGIDAIFLDLDGTIYLGGEPIEGALDFLERLKQRGIRRFFLSNNSSKSVSQYLEKLTSMGIPATEQDILLSTHDLLSWLKKEGITETYLVGTEGMREMLEDDGIRTRAQSPQYVVLGYDTEINYEKLSTASIHLHRGCLLYTSPSPRDRG